MCRYRTCADRTCANRTVCVTYIHIYAQSACRCLYQTCAHLCMCVYRNQFGNTARYLPIGGGCGSCGGVRLLRLAVVGADCGSGLARVSYWSHHMHILTSRYAPGRTTARTSSVADILLATQHVLFSVSDTWLLAGTRVRSQ
jgi:hypothetical protein